jgi:hypothetical protein
MRPDPIPTFWGSFEDSPSKECETHAAAGEEGGNVTALELLAFARLGSECCGYKLLCTLRRPLAVAAIAVSRSLHGIPVHCGGVFHCERTVRSFTLDGEADFVAGD